MEPAPRGAVDARLASIASRAALLVAVLLAVPALRVIEPWTLRWDSAAQAACAQRVASLPGGVYVAGTDHKGPLWTSLYVLAWHLAPDDGRYWTVIAALVLVVAALTGDVVRRLVVALGGSPSVGLGVGLALATHLALGSPEYARILYSRNVTVLLTGAALLLALRLREDGAGWRAATGGLLLGLAVQTMPTTALAGAVVTFAAAAALREGRPWSALLRERRRPLAAFLVGVAAPLLGVPLWYAARGELEDFWLQWWTYNRLYAEAVPLSLPRRLVAMAVGGARELAAPRYLPLVVGLVVLVADRVRGRRSWPLALALLWAAAEAVSMASTLRFFEHYQVLVVVPTTVVAGLLASRALARAPRLDALAAPALLAGALLVHAGPALVAAPPPAKPHLPAVGAVLDVVSERGEYVYVWARNVTDYALLRRRAPTRYVENRWLRGELYGVAGASPRYVLPGTLDRWRADVAATPPCAVVEDARSLGPAWGPAPIEPGSVVDRWRAERFVEVWAWGGYRVDVARERWAWVEAQRRAVADLPPAPPPTDGGLWVDAGGPDLSIRVVDLELTQGGAGVLAEVVDGRPTLSVLARRGAAVLVAGGTVLATHRAGEDGRVWLPAAPAVRFTAVRGRTVRPPWAP